ncbi:MAG: class I SAM-dependent methyltransferase [Desmonostoc vinosum HA7617-LM4]|jgi:SAM-dependent methyltransferase|nr:class I SAM-dependent methyltransferase [Desmonostoc vinosum HA7617-LM4]
MNQEICSPVYDEYDFFARMYNDSWGPRYCEENIQFLEKLLLHSLTKQAQILDLCCGTGQLVQELVTRGYQVTGLDASEAMLSYAEKNVPDAKFILADARSFNLPSSFDVVVSTSGSLNHFLNLSELTEVFCSVYQALLPNGTFVIDMNLEEAFKLSFLDKVEDGDVKEDYAWASRSSYNSEDKIGRINMILFSLIEQAWQRFDTTWLVRGYSQSEVKSGLEKASFTNISVFDAKRDLGLDKGSGKTFFICHKIE